jgi:predicted DNA-binding transcriptional regulator YafY
MERAVQVRFRNIAARIAAERWPDQIEERSDDTVLLTAKLTPGPYLYGWVLGFAGDAEVVAPEDVRQGFLAHVEELRRVYANPAAARVGS